MYTDEVYLIITIRIINVCCLSLLGLCYYYRLQIFVRVLINILLWLREIRDIALSDLRSVEKFSY